jgi:hypothetical protein
MAIAIRSGFPIPKIFGVSEKPKKLKETRPPLASMNYRKG